MELNFFIALVSIVFFSFCARKLIQNLRQLNHVDFSEAVVKSSGQGFAYARQAVWFGRFYQVLAWGLMTFSFLLSLIYTWYELLLDNPLG